MLVSIENSEIFAQEVHLPKQKHAHSQGKMPTEIKIRLNKLTEMRKGESCCTGSEHAASPTSPCSALVFLCLLLQKFYVERDKENHEAFSTYLQLLL